MENIEKEIKQLETVDNELNLKFEKLKSSIITIRDKHEDLIEKVAVMDSILFSIEVLLEEYKKASDEAVEVLGIISRLEDDLSIAQALSSYNRILSDKRNLINEIRKGLIDLQKLILETRKVEIKERMVDPDSSIKSEILEGFESL